MKTLSTILSITLLAGATAASADPIKTFKALCLAHPGDTGAIVAAGKKAGFVPMSLGSDMDKNTFIGEKKSTGEALEVNAFTSHSFECALAVDDMQNPEAVRAAFFKAIGLPTDDITARGTIGGKTYTFLHDTNGGETFVMFAD
ncbi:MAG: hypothetical protein ORN49_04250 [Rhodobacteraceae bacterium]|nr:hypothetical protein [Paracoccaceae bacterium]